MKKIIFLVWLVLLLPGMALAQERVEAPVWNVGDKWNFTGDGSIEVIKGNQSGYVLQFSDKKCKFESQECSAIFFERATRNRINAVDGDIYKKYVMGLSKILDFPLSPGKQWKTVYSATRPGIAYPLSYDYSESYKTLGWEEIAVQAGKFKVLRLEYKRLVTSTSGWGSTGEEIINQYWYSPDAKYFVKCIYDNDWMKGEKEIFNWELTSFQLKK